MLILRSLGAALVALISMVASFAVLSASSADAATASVVTVRVRAAIQDLPVRSETRAGYDRDKFRLWIDANGDCQDTRDEVLDAESRVAVSGCDIQRGTWVSYYDRVVVRDSSALDIDHLVPLAEAWDSGAKRWNADTRKRYANDLGDARTLVAVTASTNRSKGDRDPADWLPQYSKCKYVRQWVAVKTRWSLSVNRAEKRVLVHRAQGCKNVTLRVRKASIVKSSTSTSGGTTSGSTDPRFDYCYQAKAAGYGPYYKSRDTEYWWYTDSDSDGIVCE
jgi:hypothetical protein